MLSDEVLQMIMFIILPIAAVVILWRRNLPDENRDDGTLNLKKALLALEMCIRDRNWAEECQKFTPELSCVVVDGDAVHRAELAESLSLIHI